MDHADRSGLIEQSTSETNGVNIDDDHGDDPDPIQVVDAPNASFQSGRYVVRESNEGNAAEIDEGSDIFDPRIWDSLNPKMKSYISEVYIIKASILVSFYFCEEACIFLSQPDLLLLLDLGFIRFLLYLSMLICLDTELEVRKLHRHLQHILYAILLL
ncbi:hypothetical protein ACJX0J_007992, partial [Zea mays]